MRGPSLLSLLIFGILLAAVPRPSAGRGLEIRPVAQDAKGAATVPGGRKISPEAARAQAARIARWRSFPDHLSPKGFDWSPAAGRKSPTPMWMRRDRKLAPETVAGGSEPARLRVALIRIDFNADRLGDQSSGTGRFDLSGPDTLVPPIDRPPHNLDFYNAHLEALRRYFDTQSYGRVQVEGEVWPRDPDGAYSLPDMADLGPWEFSQDIYGAAVRMFRQMIFAADSQSTQRKDRIPWETYDRIILVHAGSDLQSDVRRDSPLDIPSFTIGVGDSDRVIFHDDTLSLARVIDRAAIIPETVNQDGYFGAINGVLTHECGHLFFFFSDLYNVNTGEPTVGFWSLMDSGNLVGSIVVLPDQSELFATGLLPPSVDPWQRYFATDALTFPEMAYGDTVALRSSQRHPDVRRVTLSSDEYLLLENRYLAPADSVELDQDETTRVVLGPKRPDRHEYDALLPGGGVVVWHVDESVIPNEYVFPCDSARANEDCGFNTNYFRPAISVIEADGLDDLGDPGSPYLLGAPFDPFFVGNNTTLSDDTQPNLRPHIGTRPHVRLEVLDPRDSTMRVAGFRTWQRPFSPLAADLPRAGPVLLAIDADGDRDVEVCWAGGAEGSPDQFALFALDGNGAPLAGSAPAFARLDRRPRPEMAAIATGEAVGPGDPGQGPSLFAVSTYADGPDTNSAGGRVWLIDHRGIVVPGWPARLPAIVTTPPVISGFYATADPMNLAHVYVGCADGRVYQIALDGSITGVSDLALPGGVTGRLAVRHDAGASWPAVAAGGATGDVAVFQALATGFDHLNGWPRSLGVAGFLPDFLWIDFGGTANSGQSCEVGSASLVAHHADRLWAFCSDGEPLTGWGRSLGDTLVAGLGAGDPDGDGFPEVLAQTLRSQIFFLNRSGYPSPGWPRAGSREGFLTTSPPLALDVDGDGRSEVVAPNASGIIAAVGLAKEPPPGWPLATGLGSTGSAVAADLDRDGTLELVAADDANLLYFYSLPVSGASPTATSWRMSGGDPGRRSYLPIDRTPAAPAASRGPLVSGTLKAYPNPARRSPVSFAYFLTEPADVEFRIVDVSGHEVAAFTRRGRQSDNLEIWDPGSLPAGLYLARVRFRGTGTERIEVLPVGLLR